MVSLTFHILLIVIVIKLYAMITPTKVLVFPIVLYGAETWTMRKHEKEDRRFRVVVLEKSTESIVDGEKDKHG